MPIGQLSIRVDSSNRLHHIWCNNGTWWAAYVLHFGERKRRIRRSLKTSCVDEAIRRRDALFDQIARDGEEVPERRPRRQRRADEGEERPAMLATVA
jgi:hypothetical protein